MFKNYIFDFGQVLVRYQPEYMTSAFVTDTDDKKLLNEVIFDRLYWDRLDSGSISDDEVKEAVCSLLPQRLHKSARDIYNNWYKNLPLIDGMSELLDSLKSQGKKLYLLSNISCGFAESYKNVAELKALLSKFDGLVFSGPIKMTKPSPEIFEHLLSTFDLKAEDCIFIDDSNKNILGAEVVGICGYLFDGDSAKLKKHLLG